MTTHAHTPRSDIQRQLTAMRAAAHDGDLITLTDLDLLGPLTEISRDYLSQQLRVLVGDHVPQCDPLEDDIIRAATYCALYAHAQGWTVVAQLLRRNLARHWPKEQQSDILGTAPLTLSPRDVLHRAVAIQVHHDNSDILLPALCDLLGVDLVAIEDDQPSLGIDWVRPTGSENWRWLSPVGSTARLAVFSWALLPLLAMPIIADPRTNLAKGPYPLREHLVSGTYGRYLHDRVRDKAVQRYTSATQSWSVACEVVRLARRSAGRARSIDERWNLRSEDVETRPHTPSKRSPMNTATYTIESDTLNLTDLAELLEEGALYRYDDYWQEVTDALSNTAYACALGRADRIPCRELEGYADSLREVREGADIHDLALSGVLFFWEGKDAYLVKVEDD